MENLKNILNLLWASKILDYHIDMLLCRVSFLIETMDNGETHRYEIIFNKVSLFYFVNNVTDSRMNIFEPEEDDYLELTSVNILKEAELLIESRQDKWIKQYNGEANICIEIWNKLLLIEADSIKINDEVFSLVDDNTK